MKEFPQSLKIATVWLLVGAVVFVAVQWWLHQRQQTSFEAHGGKIEIRRGADGHYHWPGRVNGTPVDFLIDTGATSTTISQALASELALAPLGSVQGHTAGGVVTGALVRANITLQGGVHIERLTLTALPTMSGRPLLGMDVLSKLRWQQRDGVLLIDTDPLKSP